MEKVYKVNICGVELIFSSGENEERTQQIVDKVKQLIKKTMDESELTNVTKASMLSCMSICAEYFCAQSQTEEMRERMMLAQRRVSGLETKCTELSEENEKLRSALINVKIELSNNKE